MIPGIRTQLLRGVMSSLAVACWVACPVTSSAQTMYKWVDDKGVTHFSETPPADGNRNAKKIEVKPIVPDKPAADNWREREQEAKQRRAKQGAEDETARRHEEAQRAQNCRAAQRKADTMKNYSRVFRLDEKGERVYLEERERDSQLAEANQEIARHCR